MLFFGYLKQKSTKTYYYKKSMNSSNNFFQLSKISLKSFMMLDNIRNKII
jgi:hypothetical protein